MWKFLYALMGFLLAFSVLRADDFLEEANENSPSAFKPPHAGFKRHSRELF